MQLHTNSHRFDAFARTLAQGVSRRSLLRWMGVSTVGAIAAGMGARFSRLASAANTPISAVRPVGQSLPPPPPAEPWSPENPPYLDYVINDNDYLDGIATVRMPEKSDQAFPGFDWCEIVWAAVTNAMPTLAGFASTFTPFSRNCGERDCLQCCYNGSTGGCHSSYIGFPVLNCNEDTYGAGTKPVGLTLIIDPDSIEPDETCLFIPQVCAHIAQCVSEGNVSALSANSANRFQAQQALAENYLTDPRAVDQRARFFAIKAQEEVQSYLDSYNTSTPDARPLHSLAESLTNRGHAGWRSELTNTPIDISDPALRINDSAGNLNESASWANAAHLLALARVLTGVPNLAARLAYVESRKWTQAEKDAYLSGIGDPHQAMLSMLDPHWATVIQRLPVLQDYALLLVPLAGETVTEGMFGGQPLGHAPTLSLRAAASNTEVALTISVDDPEDMAGGLARPIAVDWGDGHVTHHSLPSGQSTLEVAHAYVVAGRYAIYAVAANNSGLRGHAALVVEVSAQAALATLPTISRIQVSGLALTNWLSTQRFSVEARLVDAAGQSFRAGRSAPGRNGAANVPIAFGDLYAHNPARLNTTLLRLVVRNELAAPVSKVFSPYLSLAATMKLGVFSTTQQQLVEQPVTLTPEMLKVYLAGATTPMPSSTVTVEASGALRIPLFWRAASNLPWQKVERIEIALAPEMFNGFVLDAAPTTLPAGTLSKWIETRPGTTVFVPEPPAATPTPTSTPTSEPTSSPITPSTATPTPTSVSAQHKVFLPFVRK